MDIVAPQVEEYLAELAARDDEEVLLEMEALAQRENFPIIGRLCGGLLELLARSIGARRIFEMGSGYGYSAYWFSRATGSDGEIHLSDLDPTNRDRALVYLERAGLDGPIDFHVADAFDALSATEGEFDIVYCDIDKDGYPRAWREARERVRVGGFFICDNMLWSGRVTGSEVDDPHEGWTRAIAETNEAIFADRDFRPVIVPLRDGVVVALRLR